MLGQLDSVHPFRDFQLPGPGTKIEKHNSRVCTNSFPKSLSPQHDCRLTGAGYVPQHKYAESQTNPGLMHKE